MNKEEKSLLLKDLCARLPYGVRVCYKIHLEDESIDVTLSGLLLDYFNNKTIVEIKPYLRPLSSMTKEEKIELCKRAYVPDEMKTLEKKIEIIEINAKNVSDFYNEHHFDYRGLIEKDMALEATEEMYNFN